MAADASLLKIGKAAWDPPCICGIFPRPPVKGQLQLTTSYLLFTPNSTKVPEIRIPLDAVADFYVPTGWRRSIGARFWWSGLYPALLQTNDGEKMMLHVEDRQGWRNAIPEAAKRYAYCLTEDLNRTDTLMDQGKEQEALALCEETIKTARSPMIHAYGYCCLAAVQRRRGNHDKATEALARATVIKNDHCKDFEALDQKIAWEAQQQVIAAVRRGCEEAVQVAIQRHLKRHNSPS